MSLDAGVILLNRKYPFLRLRKERHLEDRKKAYEQYWSKIKLKTLKISADTYKKTPCEWQKQRIIANPIGIKRLHLLYLMKIIEQIQPKSVLEIGSGQGLNLLILASRYPDIKFYGLELTDKGIGDSKNMQSYDTLPKEFVDYSPLPITNAGHHKKISFIQGDARKITLDDNSVDVVFSRQALEQMNDIRDEVFKEISRVTTQNVVMFEAFKDWNNKGLKKTSIASKNIFQGSIEELKKYSLKPIYTNKDFPSKINMRVGLVICQKV